MMSQESKEKSQIVEITVSGMSMYPRIRSGETLSANLFKNPREITDLEPGSVVLHRDRDELMVHRINDHCEIESDWHQSKWPGPVYGMVYQVKADNRTYPLRFLSSYNLISRLTNSKIRAIRWTGKLGLTALNFLDRNVIPIP